MALLEPGSGLDSLSLIDGSSQYRLLVEVVRQRQSSSIGSKNLYGWFSKASGGSRGSELHVASGYNKREKKTGFKE
ncbi:hypothetical protein A8B98_11150 [Hymenobacter sp. UV11]|nr:hypothetical protein A8B98_11150 [Hymenobacter sp. UV11]